VNRSQNQQKLFWIDSETAVETLLQIKWWEWSIDEINDNAIALMSPDIFFKKFGKK